MWSRKGEFLGIAGILAGNEGEALVHSLLSVSRDPGEGGTTFTVHRFSGGYRLRVREWWDGGEEMLWLAPVEEGEEAHVALLSGADGDARGPATEV